MSEQLLSGWGRTAATRATVTALSPDQVGAFVSSRAHPRGLLARGLGKSYGDAAQNAGGDVLRVAAGAIELDEESATVTASAGTTLADVIDHLLPRGFFPMTVPGTRRITLGGAVACDVHGKNHHRDGGFGSHVLGLELVGGDGRTRRLDPAGTPEAFWATVGGLGLTGVITRVTFRVRRVETAYVRGTQERLPDLDRVIERMTALDASAPYTVAWLDLHAAGASLGRGLLDHGDHAAVDELSTSRRRRPLAPPGTREVGVPATVPANLMTRPAVRAFNEAWFHKASRRPHTAVKHLAPFFFPLDAVAGWNRIYGPRGFVQYQLVVPDRAVDQLVTIIRDLAASARCSFLNVLKRLGPADPAPLSFPQQGWTLAVDLAADPSVVPLLRDLDARVLEAGGRVYLGKDSRVSAPTVAAMYPRLGDFQAARAGLGAAGVFTSDLSRRLRLDEAVSR